MVNDTDIDPWALMTPAERAEAERLLNDWVPEFPAWLPKTAPKDWVWDWPHQLYLYDILQDVTSGVCDRLMISMPPRHTKSETITIRYVAWRICCDPKIRVVVACYNAEHAERFSRKIKRIVSQAGVKLSGERKAASEWETTAGGGLRAVGVGSGITGMGFDLLMIDDPVKSREEADSDAYRNRCYAWYTDDLYTRQEPWAAVILVMTRWHQDDLAGRILASPEAKEWRRVSLPAICEGEADELGRDIGEALCPDRYDIPELERIKGVMGSYAFNALYQGSPSPPEGDLIKKAWFRFWGYHNMPDSFDEIIQSWDTAMTKGSGDRTSGGVWGRKGANIYLLDRVTGQWDTPQVLAEIKKVSIRYPLASTKLIERKANGAAVIDLLHDELAGIVPIEPRGDKISRVHAVLPVIESGNVYLPDSAIAPWVEEYIEELCGFPTRAHDDDVDMTTMALDRLRPNSRAAEEAAKEKVPDDLALWLKMKENGRHNERPKVSTGWGG